MKFGLFQVKEGVDLVTGYRYAFKIIKKSNVDIDQVKKEVV